MYTDSTLAPIRDGEPYTAPDGTNYPGGFPRSLIPGLRPVSETAPPADETLVVTGFTIDETHTQLWHTRKKTDDEIAAQAASVATIQLAALTQQRLAALEAAVLNNDKTQLKDVAAQAAALAAKTAHAGPGSPAGGPSPSKAGAVK